MAVLSPVAKQQFFDNAGNPAAGYKLYTYAANTTTRLATYSDKAGTAANANPITLDARGEATVYLLESLVYDFVLKTPNDATVWTRSGVSTALDPNADAAVEAAADALAGAIDDLVAEKSADADVVIDGLGYLPPVSYAAGIAMTSSRQTVEYDGETYAPFVSELPFTTSGTFEAAKFRLIQGVSSADLASTASGKGASLVGFLQSGTGAVARTIQDKARERVSVADFMSDAERADIALASPLLDHTASVQKSADALVARGGGVLEFPANATLRINQMKVLGTSDAWLSGVRLEGNGAKIIANDVDLSPGSGIIWAGYVDGLEITGFDIDGHYEGKVAIDTGRNHALRIGPAKNVDIHDNYLHNLGSGNTTDIGGDALYTGMVEGLRFHHNRVRGWGRWVIACVDWMSGVDVSNNVCQFYAADPQRPYVLGFIDLESNTAANPIVNVSITGNIVDYATGIACSASMDATTDYRRSITISGNTMIGSLTDDRATYLGGAYNYGVNASKVDGLVIACNYIELGGDISPIIQLDTAAGSVFCANVVISGNNLRHRADGGLNIYANNCLVIGNSIFNESPTAASSGAFFRAGCSNCHFIGNVVNNAGTSFPLQFTSTGYSTVSGNRFISSVRASVAMSPGTHVFGNSGTAVQYSNVAGATDARIGPSIADMYTNLVTSPVEGQKAVLPYFVKQILQHSAAPTTGTWARGDIVFNSSPAAGGKIGWVCTTGGAPGTWKAFGVIDP